MNINDTDRVLTYYLSLETKPLIELRDTLIEGRGNPILLAAISDELARRAINGMN